MTPPLRIQTRQLAAQLRKGQPQQATLTWRYLKKLLYKIRLPGWGPANSSLVPFFFVNTPQNRFVLTTLRVFTFRLRLPLCSVCLLICFSESHLGACSCCISFKWQMFKSPGKEEVKKKQNAQGHPEDTIKCPARVTTACTKPEWTWDSFFFFLAWTLGPRASSLIWLHQVYFV